MIDLNKTAQETYKIAIKRGKISETKYDVVRHYETCSSIREEVSELSLSNEKRESSHIKGYTETEEELVDILISCLTELRRRDTDVEAILRAKVEFNKKRV